jgi:hypothetical protein
MQVEGRRAGLLQAVAQFVREAAGLPGVLRIALIGSLVTAKPAPRDADVLVTVEDGMDLGKLARAGRRLKGPPRASISGRTSSSPIRRASTSGASAIGAIAGRESASRVAPTTVGGVRSCTTI